MAETKHEKLLLLEEIADRLAGEYADKDFNEYTVSDDGRYISKEVDLPTRSMPLTRIRYRVAPHKLPIYSIADTLKIKPQLESVDVFFRNLTMVAIRYMPSDLEQELRVSLYASATSRTINARYEEIFRRLYERLPAELKGQAGLVKPASQSEIYFTLPQSRLNEAKDFLSAYMNEVRKV